MKSLVPGPVPPGSDGWDMSSPDPGLFAIRDWVGGMTSPGPDSVPSEGRGRDMSSPAPGHKP